METKGERPAGAKFFRDCMGANSKMLRYMGLLIGVEGNKRDRRSRVLERLPTVVSNILCLLDGFFQIRWITELWSDDRDLVMQITTSGISNFACICKGYRLAMCREDLQTVFEKLADIWKENAPRDEIRLEVTRRAHGTLVFCKCYIIMMLALGLSFGLPPLKNLVFYHLAKEKGNRTFDYSARVFLMRYPFEVNSQPVYLSVLLEEELVLFLSALYWVCCDTLFAQLTTHTSLHFEILQHDIKQAISGEDDDDRLKIYVIAFIKRHQELLRVCTSIEKIFSPVLFTTMLLTSINICVNMLELQENVSTGKYGNALFHVCHLVNIFFQLLVYCIFAEQLTQQASMVANAVYNCRWTGNNYKFRAYCQLLIMKSQKPFYCTAYGFFTIGHKRITAIVNRALSFYMMLQTTNDRAVL